MATLKEVKEVLILRRILPHRQDPRLQAILATLKEVKEVSILRGILPH